MDSIWIAIASILTVYTVEKALSEDGVEISPSIEYTSSLIRFVLITPIEVINNPETHSAAQNLSSVVLCLDVKRLYVLSNRLALTQVPIQISAWSELITPIHTNDHSALRTYGTTQEPLTTLMSMRPIMSTSVPIPTLPHPCLLFYLLPPVAALSTLNWDRFVLGYCQLQENKHHRTVYRGVMDACQFALR